MSTIDNQPLVSVFILCYNHEKYVAESIESVLNQTYSNLELVIVDNASTDNSRAIIEFYAQKDSRIRFFSMEYNTFPSYGSNYAIQQCNGEYICGLSADDKFVEQKIEIQLQYMLENDFNNSFTWVKVVDDYGIELTGHWADKLFNRTFVGHELEHHFIVHGNTLCAITWMFHKNMFSKYGYFDNRLIQTQDFDLWLRILAEEKINILYKKLTYYRVRGDGGNLSISMDRCANIRSHFEALYFIRRVFKFDLEILSSAIDVSCNSDNKFINFFNYYLKNKNYTYAAGVLFAMYETLGTELEFPSNLYLDFFKTYSNYDFLYLYASSETSNYIQLFVDQGNGFTEELSEKTPVLRAVGVQEFTFELKDFSNLIRLRLDPLDCSCAIKVKAIDLIMSDGNNMNMLPHMDSHEVIYHNDILLFAGIDPSITFPTLDSSAYKSAKALKVVLEYVAFGEHAAILALKEMRNIQNEIMAANHSKIWKFFSFMRNKFFL